ncbi:hypothetical protein [Streptomyces sp. NPDC047928]|uniref:hypothetical protein n=1 Tax=unclassified Streptomyces TaxID=2593676 RepID=UPI003715E14E
MSADRTATVRIRRFTITEAWAETDRTGKSGACVIDEHGFCHPVYVYVRHPGRPRVGPAVSAMCTCSCHIGRSVRRHVLTP